MLRALLIGSLLIAPASLAFACDDDDTASDNNDNDDNDNAEVAEPDTPETPETPTETAELDTSALEARVEALEERVAALEQGGFSTDADSDDNGDDCDVEGAIEID
jgi:hypothetical protein